MLLAIGGILIRAAITPTSFRISRSVIINAPPEKVYPMIANLRHWNAWNPFSKQDPHVQITYSGPESGVGAHYAWTSTGQTGVGNMTVTGATPQAINMDLNFEKPFSASNKVVFGMTPKEGGTEVSWTMSGPSPFLNRIVSVFMSPDKLVGGEFEKGLADLKEPEDMLYALLCYNDEDEVFAKSQADSDATMERLHRVQEGLIARG
eukprot:gene33036-55604_t